MFILLYCIHDLQRGIPYIKLSIVLQICTQRFLQVTTCKMRLVRRRLYPVQCYISTCLTSYQEWHQPSPHQSTPAAQTERRTEQAICPLVDSSHLSLCGPCQTAPPSKTLVVNGAPAQYPCLVQASLQTLRSTCSRCGPPSCHPRLQAHWRLFCSIFAPSQQVDIGPRLAC